MKDHPKLGSDLPGETRCGRIIRSRHCLKPGAMHVVWEGNLGSMACVSCGEFARENRHLLQIHPTGPGCNDPRAFWFPQEQVCRLPVQTDPPGSYELVLP